MRQELRQWLRRFHDDLGVTSLFVTHDQEEAFEVADEVVVMRGGRVEQVGTPQEVFDNPANAFVMDFLGNVNVCHGRVRNGQALVGQVEISYPQYPHSEEKDAAIYVCPHELELERLPHGRGGVEAKVLHINPAGPRARVQLVATDCGAPLQVEVSLERLQELHLRMGDQEGRNH